MLLRRAMATFVRRVAAEPALDGDVTAVAAALAAGALVAGGDAGGAASDAVSLRLTPIRSPADDRAARFVRLANGARVLLISDPDADRAAAAAAVAVGHLGDPWTRAGLAHMVEHLLFYASRAYPAENEYKSFLKARGGACNASTAAETTTYHFTIRHEHLAPAFDRFAQFFLAPTLTSEGVGREVRAVDSENSNNLTSDGRRALQLRKHLTRPGHPWRKFGTGNLTTLLHARDEGGARAEARSPEAALHAAVVAHYERHYAARIMSVAVLGRQSLDELEALVTGGCSEATNAALHRVRDHEVPEDSDGGAATLPHPYLRDAAGVHPDDGAAASDAQRCWGVGTVAFVAAVADVRELRLLWPIATPPEPDAQRAHSTVTHCLGHEGTGSLLSWLKRRGWATALSAGASALSAFATLDVSISLTPAGMAALPDVVASIYAYAAVLAAASEADWRRLQAELAQASENSARFRAKPLPLSAVLDGVASLGKGPAALSLIGGPLLPREPALAAVADVIARLTPANALMLLQARTYDGDGAEAAVRASALGDDSQLHRVREPAYGYEYWATGISETALTAWQRARDGGHALSTGSLALPPPNIFLPSDFAIVDVATAATGGSSCGMRLGRHRWDWPMSEGGAAPVAPIDFDAIMAEAERLPAPSPRLELWHRADSVFRLPRAYASLEVRLPAALEASRGDVAFMAATQLYVQIVSDVLVEQLYDAGRSGLSWAISPPTADRCHALVITVGGYHNKLPALLRRVCEALPTIARADHADFAAAFARAHDEASRAVRSFVVEGPRAHIADARSCLLLPHHIRPAAYEDALSRLTPEALLAAVETLWTAPRAGAAPLYRAVVYGNIDAAAATAMAADATAALDGAFRGLAAAPAVAAAPTGLFPLPRAAIPAPGTTIVVTKRHPNPSEVNAAVAVSHIVDGVRTPRTMALASLLSMLISHTTFDTLRTKQQLGYIVSSDVQAFARTALAITVVVQSSVASVAALEARIDALVASLEERVLAALSDEELRSQQTVLASRMVEPPKTQGAQFGELNEAVARVAQLGGSPDFHRDEATAAAVRAIDRESLVRFARATLSPTSSTLRKVVVRVYSAAGGGGGGGGESACSSGAGATAGGAATATLIDGGPTSVPARMDVGGRVEVELEDGVTKRHAPAIASAADATACGTLVDHHHTVGTGLCDGAGREVPWTLLASRDVWDSLEGARAAPQAC